MWRALLHDKTQLAMHDRHVRAFTLIELLVVITIIVVLLGLLFPAFQGVQNQSKKTQAKNDLTQIVTAVNAFYTEYGRYPTSATTDANAKYGAGSSNTNDALLNELRATGTFSLNTRQIVFISPPDAKDQTSPRGGIKTSNGQYFDPWGNAYSVAIDADYDNQVTPNPYGASGGAGADPIRQGVIAWSVGKDMGPGKNGNNKFSASDDVISWQ
jgi:prepilin-type N-terminal cleavage/methylation domain-containing protein